MKLGFVSAILPDLALEAVLGYAARLGYDCVELMCWPPGRADRRYAGVTHLDVTGFTPDMAARTRQLCQTAGVAISGLGYYPNPLSPDMAEAAVAVDHLGLVIQAAALLGVPQVNTFVGRDWSKSIDANWPRFLQTWRPLVALAEDLGVRIGIENCPMLFSQDEWPGGKNLATSPGPAFGLNYDPSHLVWQQMDYLKPLREFRDRLFHVHAKDVRLDRDRLDEVGILATPLEYHSPKLPGLGEVNWGRFFSVLGDCGYSGPVCVEVEDRAYESSLATRLMALQQSYDFLRNFVARQSPAG